MEHITLSRAYLETLTTDDLVRLGDELGVDIPFELNRRLIIGELLEIQEKSRSSEAASSPFDDPLSEKDDAFCLDSYNETRVSVLLRNPGWLFVFWDFSAAEFSACTQREGFECFSLRLSFFDDAALAASRDSYNTDVSPLDRKWYIHMHEQNCFCRVDLLAMNSLDKNLVLARSTPIFIPPAAGIEVPKSINDPVPPILSLSGIEELRRKYRRCHRQSFL